jgi:hypothetical protein
MERGRVAGHGKAEGNVAKEVLSTARSVRDRCAIVVEAARPRALILFAALAMQTSIRRGCSDSKLSELFAPRRRKIGKAGNPDAAG